jgi:hypothetical protein
MTTHRMTVVRERFVRISGVVQNGDSVVHLMARWMSSIPAFLANQLLSKAHRNDAATLGLRDVNKLRNLHGFAHPGQPAVQF